VAKEIEYDVVKAKFQEFVQGFLSGEEGTERTELLPNLWAIVNKKHNFKATIECEFRRSIGSMGKEEWFAVVTENGEKSNFLLEFDEE
jgi:hypothetical protein